MKRVRLLSSGPLSTLLYMAMCIIIPGGYTGYDSLVHTISELSAVGAPTRTVWVAWGVVYTILVTAFGVGVLQSAGGNGKLRITGQLMILYGLSGFLWPVFPMHMREVIAAGGGTATDTMHITLGMISVAIMVTMMVFGAVALKEQFRIYTFTSIALLFVFGALTAMDSSGIDAGTPTPYLGLWERICIGTFMVWVAILGLKLIKGQKA
jgi:hypothetical protein